MGGNSPPRRTSTPHERPTAAGRVRGEAWGGSGQSGVSSGGRHPRPTAEAPRAPDLLCLRVALPGGCDGPRTMHGPPSGVSGGSQGQALTFGGRITTEPRPPHGPFALPSAEGPSSVGDWTIYRQSESVMCPGTYRERRTADRGDRRVAARSGACRHRWGRVTAGEWHVRHKRLGQPDAVGETVVLECPDCHCPIEFSRPHAVAA